MRWTELARTPSYVMRLASVLHTEPMRAIHEDEKPSRQPLHWETVFAGPATRPLPGALMRETHPLLDAARARWAIEEEPRRAALDLAARRREEAQIERRIAAGRAMERRREERRRAREDQSSRADPWSPGGSLGDP